MNYFLEEWVDPSKIFSGKRNPHVAISTIPLLLTTMKSHSQFEANYLLDRIYNKALQSNKLNFDRFSVEPDVNSAFPINNKLNLPFVGNDAKAFCFQINRQVRSCDPCLEKARAKLNNSFYLGGFAFLKVKPKCVKFWKSNSKFSSSSLTRFPFIRNYNDSKKHKVLYYSSFILKAIRFQDASVVAIITPFINVLTLIAP